jgi:hypothetical protein
VDTITGKGETSLLTPLFEARLQLQSDMEGELVGSGNGTVSGDLRSRDSALVNVRR